MTKRGALFIVAILTIALTILSVVILRGRESVLTDPYKFVPEDACFIIESYNLAEFSNNLTSENGIFRELSSVKEISTFDSKLKAISRILNNNDFRPFFENSKVVVSFHLLNDAGLVPLLNMNLPQGTGRRQVREIIRKTIGDSLSSEINSGSGIFGLISRDYSDNDTLFFSLADGMIRCSSSSLIIRSSYSQSVSETDIRDHPGISRLMEASGKGQNSKVFIIFRNLEPLLRKILSGRYITEPGITDKIADIAGADIFIDESGIVLSGYLETDDTTDIMYRNKSVTPGIYENHMILPSDVLLFETVLVQQGKKSADSAADGNNNDLMRKLVSQYITGEVTMAITENKGGGKENSYLFICRLINRDIAERLIIERTDLAYQSTGNGVSEWVRQFQPDEQTSIAIYSTPFNNIIGGMMPGKRLPVKDTLVTFFDDYMVTSNSSSALTDFLYSNILNKTLGNDIAFREFERTMPSRAGYYFYCVPADVINWLSCYVSDSVSAVLRRNISELRKIQAVGYQFAASNKMIYNTLSVKYEENTRNDSGAEWATLLDTAACIKPFFFTNHNTGAREIFIQDFNNKAYLINSAGRVLWKVELNERIIGNVFMIDYYRNGKYQLLFSGKTFIHLLDRNGNYVERYPVKLRSPASAPSALFDYEGTRDYRLFIPGEDRLIYAYDKSGSVVKGWTPFRTNGRVITDIKFFRVSGKDYLVASDDNTVYFLDRTGNIRLRAKEPVIRAHGSEMRIDPSSGQSVVFTKPDGTVQNVSFTGNVRTTVVMKFSEKHSFDFSDMDNDGRGEFIFIDKGVLYLFDDDKTLVYKKEFGNDEIEGPINFVFASNDRRTGVFDRRNKQIYLFDKDGNIDKGFPLRGASLFSIGKLNDNSTFNLIVGGDDSFLYNYRVSIETK